MPEDLESSGGASAKRRWLINGAKGAVSLLLMGLLLSNVDGVRLWRTARSASLPWLAGALALYAVMVIVSAWRWGLLLRAQRVSVRVRTLLGSFLVATFFNNFLPSNIGGDIIRITDTAKPAGSKTLATTVILIDRGLGLLALVFVAALGATLSAGSGGSRSEGALTPALLWAAFGVGAIVTAHAVVWPELLRRLLSPLRWIHAEWVDRRLEKITGALQRFRQDPAALAGGIVGALAVQGVLVLFYVAIVRSLGLAISTWDLAVIVPMSFLVQMLPVSLNGFGVREATFAYYFTELGVSLEAALVVSLLGAGLIMLFSLTGAAVYVTRGT